MRTYTVKHYPEMGWVITEPNQSRTYGMVGTRKDGSVVQVTWKRFYERLARRKARQNAPSRLLIFNKDGERFTEHRYRR